MFRIFRSTYRFLVGWICIHEWEKLCDFTIKSAYESSGMDQSILNYKTKEQLVDLLSTKHVTVVACKKCGVVKYLESKNP